MDNKTILLVLAAALLTPGFSLAKDNKSKNPASDMEQAMAAAEAGAKRPGDEKMSCEDLQKEFLEAANNPQLRAAVARGGEQAQKDMQKMNEAAAAQIALGTAMSAAGSVPGGDWMTTGAAMAQNAKMMAQAQQHLKERRAQGEDFKASLPQMMRGQRLFELAQAKNCEWTKAQ
jgi:hypothetical protein